MNNFPDYNRRGEKALVKYLEHLQYDGTFKDTMRSPNIWYLEASISKIHHEDGLYLYECSYCVIFFLIKCMYFFRYLYVFYLSKVTSAIFAPKNASHQFVP